MARTEKPLLGYITCPEGEKAEVRQTSKRGAHFYTRCTCCGLMQGTGDKVQQKIWDNAEWLPGAVFSRPSRVVDRGRVPVVSVESVEPVATIEQKPSEPESVEEYELGDFESEIEQTQGEPIESGGGVKKGLLALGVTVLAGAVACLTS